MTNIYVGNLSPAAVESDLRQAFQSHGTVESVTIVKDKRTGRSRGFGYVAMSDVVQAMAAVRALDRKPVRGMGVIVRAARKPSRPLARRETQADFGDFAR